MMVQGESYKSLFDSNMAFYIFVCEKPQNYKKLNHR